MTVENSFLSIISGSSGEYLTTKCGGVGNELMSDIYLPKVTVNSSYFLLSPTKRSVNKNGLLRGVTYSSNVNF